MNAGPFGQSAQLDTVTQTLKLKLKLMLMLIYRVLHGF